MPTYHGETNGEPGIWRYRASFGLSGPSCYLGEGTTPLVPHSVDRGLFFKCEHLNPSGSFKDRGTALMMSEILGRGIKQVLEDSSGNAGASLALYSAAFGVQSQIYIPASTSGPKRKQIERSGATVCPVDGPRENAHRAVLDAAANKQEAYASHALQPFHLPGYATIVYESYEQLGVLPATLVAPIGHGSLFLGSLMGARSLEAFMGKSRTVMHVGVQPANCAPIVKAWEDIDFEGLKKPGIAEGTQVSVPVRAKEILEALIPGKDLLYVIEEDAIQQAWKELIRAGFYVEPTSAMVWAAYQRWGKDWPKPIVLILTGSGLKFN